MRRPRSRALLVGLLALSVLSLSVQHALYLCGAWEHAASSASSDSEPRVHAAAHGGCHDSGPSPTTPADGHSMPACCGAASLASLPSGRDAVAPEALGAPALLHATTWSTETLVAAEATLRRPALDSRRSPARLRPHLALRKILV